MSQSRSDDERLILEKKRKRYLKKMNEGSVTKQKLNHSMSAKVGGRLEVCGFSA
jgi:hypothetical protein